MSPTPGANLKIRQAVGPMPSKLSEKDGNQDKDCQEQHQHNYPAEFHRDFLPDSTG